MNWILNTAILIGIALLIWRTRKMSELSDAVQSIKDDVVRIGAGVKAVLDLLQKPNPDVSAAIEALKNADAGLDAAADAMEAALPPATPPGDGGGQTGGGPGENGG
jgi:hypothetical protein